MHRALFLSAALVLAACSAGGDDRPDAAPAPQTEDPVPAGGVGEVVEVLHVFDGDSIEVLRDDGSTAEVRLIGINAPEGTECQGDESLQTLRSLLTGTEVSLLPGDEETDRFGRLLRYVFAGGRNVNLDQVAAGYALALQTGHELEPDFVEAADGAASRAEGMWAPHACGVHDELPNLVIGDYEFDPRGRDAENANQEFVEIHNAGPERVPLAGWILRDESTQHRFVFPDSSFLEPGNTLVIRSGCGSSSQSELFWCASDPVWSNGGDTIILQYPDGTIVDYERFAGNF